MDKELLTTGNGGMKNLVVQVTAPSRLHFGLLDLENPPGRSFGGVGVMLDGPRLELQLAFVVENDPASRKSHEEAQPGDSNEAAKKFCSPAGDVLQGVGDDQERHRFTALLSRLRGQWGTFPRIFCDVRQAIPPHHGLGSGTQFSLAVTRGLGVLLGKSPASPEECAVLAGRGKRSAVGVWGNFKGGLIAEEGKGSGEDLGKLYLQVSLPTAWRFVLLLPRSSESGLSGSEEAIAFARLPALESEKRRALRSLAFDRLVPASQSGDFDRFAQALGDFGELSGSIFAPFQTGGNFCTPTVRNYIERLRLRGYPGVGQSSWGPTVFVACKDESAAQTLRNELLVDAAFAGVVPRVAVPAQSGARLAV